MRGGGHVFCRFQRVEGAGPSRQANRECWDTVFKSRQPAPDHGKAWERGTGASPMLDVYWFILALCVVQGHPADAGEARQGSHGNILWCMRQHQHLF